jgi:hypothetical protein
MKRNLPVPEPANTGSCAKGFGGVGHGFDTRRIGRVAPVAVPLEIRADDERAGVGPERRQVIGRHATPDDDGDAHGRRNGCDRFEHDGLRCRDAGDDDPVRAEELRGAGGVGDVDVGGDCVAGVLLLDVGEDRDRLGADGLAIPQQGTGFGLGHEAFVGHVGEGEVLDPDEGRTGRERDGQSLAIRGGEDLDAERDVDGAADSRGDGRHGRDDLGANPAAEKGPVVHVLDDEGVEAGGRKQARLVDRLADEHVNRGDGVGGTGQRADVDHADQGLFAAEDRDGLVRVAHGDRYAAAGAGPQAPGPSQSRPRVCRVTDTAVSSAALGTFPSVERRCVVWVKPRGWVPTAAGSLVLMMIWCAGCQEARPASDDFYGGTELHQRRAGETARVPEAPAAELVADEGEPQTAFADRKLIYNAALVIGVVEADKAGDKARAMAEELGGYVQRLTNQGVTLRVPAERFHTAIERLKTLGPLVEKDIQVEDVTEQFADLELRLKNARALQARLQELLSEATTVKDTLAIEKELTRVRLEIEQLEGKIRYLQNQTTFSMITIRWRELRQTATRGEHGTLPFRWVRELGVQSALRWGRVEEGVR